MKINLVDVLKAARHIDGGCSVCICHFLEDLHEHTKIDRQVIIDEFNKLDNDYLYFTVFLDEYGDIYYKDK